MRSAVLFNTGCPSMKSGLQNIQPICQSNKKILVFFPQTIVWSRFGRQQLCVS